MRETVYIDDRCHTYLSQIQASAKKRGLEIYWVIQNRVSQTTGREYQKRTIAAVRDGLAIFQVRCNRKGAVSWDSIGQYYQSTYQIQESVNGEA